MNYNEMINSINVLIENPLFKYIEIIAGLLLVCILIFKWKLSIFFKDRIWFFLLGKQYSTFSNTNWKDFHNVNLDITHFNAIYNISAKNEKQIEDYQKWLKNNGILASQMINVKKYFDIERLKFKKNNYISIIIKAISFIILFIMFFVCLNFIFKSSALIKVGEDQPWFWVNNSSAKSSQFAWIPSTNTDWSLNKSMCESHKFDIKEWSYKVNMPLQTAKMICSHFSNERSQKDISKIIKEQNHFFIPTSIILVIIMLLLINDFWKLVKVDDLKQQIKLREKNTERNLKRNFFKRKI